LGKSENSRDDLGQPFSKYKEVNNISYKTTNKIEDKAGEKVLLTPRKRKVQRTLQKIDEILDNVDTPQYSKKKNILKMRYEKPEDMKDRTSDQSELPKIRNKSKDENRISHEEENVPGTPRKRSPQRTSGKIDHILNTYKEEDKELKYEKLEDMKDRTSDQSDLSKIRNGNKDENKISHEKENEEEKVEVTPRKRKTQRTLKKIDQILNNADTPQYSENKTILNLRYVKKL
jgi:hypothetical protein